MTKLREKLGQRTCRTLLSMLWEVRSELFGPEGIESVMENGNVSGETATVLKGCKRENIPEKTRSLA